MSQQIRISVEATTVCGVWEVHNKGLSDEEFLGESYHLFPLNTW